MNTIQFRYFRITLAGWLIVFLLYSTFHWLFPFTYWQLVALYMLAALGYGCWYFHGTPGSREGET